MSQLTKLPLDLTANALSNRILDETHTLIKVANKRNRLIVLQHGGFYTDHLQVFDNNGVILKRDVDYTSTYLYKDLSTLTGREVCGAIVVTNPNVTSRVRVSYRAVGGMFGISTEDLTAILEQLKESDLPITWDSVVGKPREYPSAEHVHKFWQLYGFENMLEVMARIVKAIQVGNSAAYQHDLDYAEHYRGLAENRLDDFVAELNAHIQRMDNPHEVTKVQAGLGQLENYPMADQTEAEAGLAMNRYMSVLTTYQAIMAQAMPLLQAHLDDKSNPHQVTAEQIDVYRTGDFMSRYHTKLPRNYPAYNANALEGRTYADLYNAARTNLNTANVSGYLPVARMGIGGSNGNYVLRGDGYWVDSTSLFRSYAPPTSKTLYIGQISTDASALTHISSTYSSVSAYPVGTVVLYTTTWGDTVHGSNGGRWYSMSQLSGAIRSAGGWITMN